MDGLYIGALVEGGEIIEPMGERILGRVALDDIHDPLTSEVLVRANEEIDENRVAKIENSGLDRVRIRSVLTCQAKRGICVECYGRDLARGRKVSIGEAVGVIAAQSIGEPGTQLTMRTFHIGGAATRRAEQSSLENRYAGTVKFSNLATVKRADGTLVVMNRNGEVVVVDTSGRERERYQVIYGAKLLVKEGQKVEPGTLIAEWDPFAMPLLTEVGGTVKFDDIIEGVTMSETLDEVTGLSRKTIVESKHPEARPRISIRDEKGEIKVLPGSEQPASYHLPQGSILTVNDGDEITPGEVIAKVPRETTKTKDITGGLPRVAELFEARKPKDHAVIAEIDGAANPHDILKVLGEKELARYLVDEVQEVYRLQGVKINDKHIETIVRQMLQKMEIGDPGDTTFLTGEQIDRDELEAANAKALADGLRPAQAQEVLQGITKASLQTRSFISAASFQETTRVLTEAAVNGKIDTLDGLKENVIVGRLIPAGTGAVMNGLREVATKRDQLILDEREKERQAKLAEQPAALPAAE